jgi:hypothetical protein
MPPVERKLAPGEIDRIRRWIALGAPGAAEGTTSGTPAAASPAVTEPEVMVSVLDVKCLDCHGRRRQEGGLDLRTRASILRGGRSGPAMVPGDPDRSLIVRRMAAGDMPPAKLVAQAKVLAVTTPEIERVRLWIAAGAPPEADPQAPAGPAVPPEARQFWAFQPPRRSEPPAVRERSRVRTPIDAFLLARLEAAGLTFAPDAEPLALLRRVYLDLIGLPPSPEEIAAYLADRSPGAYERVVDRLLGSPHYGERWARFWLDAAGYADSGGKVAQDIIRPFAYRYRDYVIRSFNADTPYDRFLAEQLAGDELADYKRPGAPTPERLDALVATGFLRTAPDGFTQYVPDRFDMLADQVEIVGSAVLGLTIQCARCHDHKYDPIPQRDYYGFSAIFRSAYDPYDWLDPERRRVELGSEDERRAVEARNGPVRAEIARLERALDEAAEPDRRRTLEAELAAAKQRLEPVPAIRALYDMGGTPTPVYVLRRGDPSSPGERVGPAVPAVLATGIAPYEVKPPWPGADSSGRRLALARWLGQAEHPLTARVFVNRIWQHHFGAGLVRTPENFGRTGQPPSHPGLLDWLATELVGRGWSVKRLHRLILLSSAYRQGSAVDAARAAADPEDVLLSRFPLRRLDAEALRDSLLAVSGRLDRRPFGPPEPIEARPDGEVVTASLRRSIYLLQRRSLPVTALDVFDAPRLEPNCIARRTSNVSAQALGLWNSDLVRESARRFAAGIVEAVGKDPDRQIERIYLAALTRPPTSTELTAARAWLADVAGHALEPGGEHPAAGAQPGRADHLALTALAHVLLNSAEFLYVN